MATRNERRRMLARGQAERELADRIARGNFTNSPDRYREPVGDRPAGDLYSSGGRTDHAQPRRPDGHTDPTRAWASGSELTCPTGSETPWAVRVDSRRVRTSWPAPERCVDR